MPPCRHFKNRHKFPITYDPEQFWTLLLDWPVSKKWQHRDGDQLELKFLKLFTHAKGTVIFLCLAKRSSCTNWTGNFQTNTSRNQNSASHFGRFLPEILDQFFKNLEKIQFYEEARFSDHVYLAEMSDEPMGGRGSNIFDHDSFF